MTLLPQQPLPGVTVIWPSWPFPFLVPVCGQGLGQKQKSGGACGRGKEKMILQCRPTCLTPSLQGQQRDQITVTVAETH